MTKHRMFVDLDRRFLPCERDKYGFDPASLYRMGVRTEAAAWDQLLQHERVVVLGEAGTGKTSEFKHQAKRLTQAGSTAFFLRLEDLTMPRRGLTLDQLSRFHTWGSGEATGWFFVDAVDETRLRGGTLHTSLGELRAMLDEVGALDRARVLLSCRVTDWLPVRDLATFKDLFPVTSPGDAKPPDTSLTADADGHEKNDAAAHIYQLAPLDRPRVAVLAEAVGVEDGPAFVREVSTLGALDLAGRPADVVSMASMYAQGSLATSLLRLIEHDVEIKLSEWDPDRKEHRDLSRERCREGAEKLALAVSLCQQAAIKATDDELVSVGEVIDPEVVLADWRSAEIRALLDRPIFDEATFGCVRFHHRTSQEFLAAKALQRLLEGGRREVERRMLVRPFPGAPAVVPAPLRAVVGWLATLDERIRLRVRQTTPEHLLRWGDPGAPTVTERLGILGHVLADAGSWARALRDTSWSDLAHFGSPEMGKQVAQWIRDADKDDAKAFLFKVAAAGRMDVSEVASNALSDSEEGEDVKCMAARALVSSGSAEMLLSLAESASGLEDEVLAAAIDSLTAQGADDDLLVRACQAAEGSRSRNSNLQFNVRWAIRDRIHADDQLQLIERLAAVVAHDPARYEWLVRPICQGFAVVLERREPSFLEVRSTLRLLASRRWEAPSEVHSVTRALAGHVRLRRELFWDRVATLRAAGTWPLENRFQFSKHRALLSFGGTSDFEWMLHDAATREDESERVLLLRFVLPMSREPERHAEIRRAVGSGPDREFVEQWLEKADEWRHREQEEAAEREREEQEHARSEDAEREAREQLLLGLLPSIRDGTHLQALHHLHAIMAIRNTNHNRRGEHRWKVIEDVYNAEIARAARDGFVAAWRSVKPDLHPMPNETLWVVVHALDGLAIEFVEETAPSSLSPDDARLAARLALHEINGHPDWFASLIDAYPQEVREVLELALDAECRGTAPEPVALQRLHVHEASRSLMMGWIVDRLSGRKKMTDTALELALRALREYCGEADLARFASLAQRRCRTTAQNKRIHGFSEWWNFLFRARPRLAVDELRRAAAQHPDHSYDLVSAACATTRWQPVDAQPEVLRDLSKLLYEHIRRDDDAPPGPSDRFPPVTHRDDAEQARNAVLHQLTQTPGREAWIALRDLADADVFAPTRHWLLRAARERLEADAPFAPIAQQDVSTFMRELEEPPRDPSALFRVACRRIEEIADQVERGDFSVRGLFKTTTTELEVQRWLANTLRNLSRGRYQVTREPEVDRQKRPDIRLSATFRGVVSLELKCAQRWTLAELEEALIDQLVGRYLQDAEARHGLLVLTNHTQEYWFGPGRRGRLHFEEIVEHLQRLADCHASSTHKIEAIHVAGIRLD